MSIVGNLRSVQDGDIDAVLARPSRVKRLLYGDTLGQDEKPLYGVIDRGPTGGTVRVQTVLPPSLHLTAWHVRRQLGRLRKRDRKPDDGWRPTGDGEHLDLDKSWQGLHFLLTGTDLGGDPPLNFIHRPESSIGDVDVGYGPARAVRSGEVHAIAAELERLPGEKLAERFDPEMMMELGIYPEIWNRDPADDDTLGYLLQYYEDLRGFVRRAADRDQGIVVYLN